MWDIFTDLKPLMAGCQRLLSEEAAFLILTAYSIRASFYSIDELAAECLAGLGGRLEFGRAGAARGRRRAGAVDVAVQPVVTGMTSKRSERVAPGPVKQITSLANPIVKDIRGLALAKNRKASGRFVAEGLKLVADAVDAGWAIDTLVHANAVAGQPLVARLAALCHARGGTVIAVNEAVLAKISRRDNPQTVLGVFRQRLMKLGAVAPAASDLWIALEQVRDPGNLGTIVRTADAVGAAGVILIGETVDPFSVEAVRATMGSIFHVPLARGSRREFAGACRTLAGDGRRHPPRRHARLPQGGLPTAGAAGHGRRAGGPLAGGRRRSAERWSRSRWRARRIRSTSRWRPG